MKTKLILQLCFRGARHGVSMQAKMKRVEERDKEYLKKIEEGKVSKKKKKSKKKTKS